MKAITNILAGVVALASAVLPQAMADRNSDYWAPENMAARQCTSVHLGYLPVLPEHTAAYQELVVEKSAPGTYFAANNFGCGYIGVQELCEKTEDGTRYVRVAIFSIWDAKDSGDNPHAAPEEERAKLVQKGRLVKTRRFGGEGTGGNSMRVFDWKEGDVIRTLVIERPDGEDFRQIAGYIWDPETQQWELLSCWRIQALDRGLGGGCGFVEDFRRNVESKKHERRATFGPAWRWDGKKWHPATQFRFSKDGNPNMEINCRVNPKLGYFSLATGGDIKPDADFQPWDVKKLPAQPAAQEPGEDVMKLINAPKLEQKFD
ncbi:MAG: DUF3472 domain-containing protein [Akkermansia sp.]|nr:DUF3472 domain-containing protein [Akkermansia sp.]